MHLANKELQILSLGLDSFVVSIADGCLRLSTLSRAGFAASLGLFDMIATLVGAAAPHAAPDIPDVLLYAALVALLAFAALMSLANLASGAPASDAPVLGLTSALLAAAGLGIGALGRRLILARAAGSGHA